jgi:hypothetical protein
MIKALNQEVHFSSDVDALRKMQRQVVSSIASLRLNFSPRIFLK